MSTRFCLALILGLWLFRLQAQNQFSILVPNTDTSTSFNVLPLAVGDKAYLIRDVFLTGFTTFGYRYGSIEAFFLSGTPLYSQKFDPVVEQVMQLIGKRSVLATNGRLLVATDQTADFNLDPQASVLWCFDTSGNKLWNLEPSFPNSISSCGSLLAGNTLNELYHFYFITDNTTGNQYLEFQYLNTDGVLLWTKRIFMPSPSQRQYLYPMSAVKLGGEIKIVFSFGSILGGSVKYESISVDLQGNLINFESISDEMEDPIIDAVAGSIDSFWVASAFNAGTNSIYPCLSAFESNFDQNVGGNCQNNLPNNSSLSPQDFRIDQDGNMFMVGSDPFTPTYLGWMAKYDVTGTLLWNKYYRFSDAFPTGVCQFNALNFTPSGGLIIAGYASEFDAPQARDYDWLLTLDNNGCFNGDCSDVITIPSDIVGTKTLKHEYFQTAVYPNPAHTFFYLKMPALQGDSPRFSLWNVSGSEVLALPEFDTNDPVQLPSGLPAGVYFWRVTGAGSEALFGKVLIE